MPVVRWPTRSLIERLCPFVRCEITTIAVRAEWIVVAPTGIARLQVTPQTPCPILPRRLLQANERVAVLPISRPCFCQSIVVDALVSAVEQKRYYRDSEVMQTIRVLSIYKELQ